MFPVVADTLYCEVPKFFTVKMPKVVPDQREKFENDELFRKLSRESEVLHFRQVLTPGSYDHALFAVLACSAV